MKFHFLEEIIFYKVYILFGPEALLELREDMMLAISSLSVGCRNIVIIFIRKIRSKPQSFETPQIP